MAFPILDENPGIKTPVATYTLIVANIFFFLAPAFSVCEVGLATGPLSSSCGGSNIFTQLISHMFFHGSLSHLAFNLWFLFVYGNNVEDMMGSLQFLIFYLISGIAGGIAYIILGVDPSIPLIGASGAISGVMAAYLLLFPKVRVNTLVTLGLIFFVVRIPAAWILLYWGLIQFLNLEILGNFDSAVAYSAHVGGFIAGLTITKFLSKRERVEACPYTGWNANIECGILPKKAWLHAINGIMLLGIALTVLA